MGCEPWNVGGEGEGGEEAAATEAQCAAGPGHQVFRQDEHRWVPIPEASKQAVLRIHDILGWIRIRGSMPLTNGSGFGSGYGSWIRILLFSSLTFKMPAKN